MKISIDVSYEVQETHRGYTSTVTKHVVDIEEMNAEPRVIAALLRGAAEEIFPSPKYATGITSGSINTNGITISNGTTY